MDNIELISIKYLLFDPAAIKVYIQKGVTGSFYYNELHKAIYKLMINHYTIYSSPMSASMLKTELEKTYRLEEYTDVVTLNTNELVDLNPEWITDNLVKYKKTKIMKEGIEQLIKTADESSLDEAEKQLAKIQSRISKLTSSGDFVFDLAENAREHLETLKIKKDIKAFPIGFKAFDDILHGIRPGWLTVLVARPKVGKCHGINTPILMHDGKIKMVQDICVGEQLMGDDSTPRTVQSLARGTEEMYRIIPNKGDAFECNGSHILVLKKSGKRLDKGLPRYLEISVNEYIKRSKELVKYKLYRVGVDFKNRAVSKYLPPYLLGAWLGDGSSAYPEITTIDNEMVDYLKDFSNSVGANLRNYVYNPYKCPRYSITYSTGSGKAGSNLTLEVLRSLNLINNKHIPEEYKINSREVRLDVLAGIIDTDGHLTGNIKNIYEITTKSEVLKTDILYIARSLGFGATARLVKKGIKKLNFVGEYWRIFISGDIHTIPVRISRKKAKKKVVSDNHRDALMTGFSIKSLGIGKYYGFELDGNHLYLLGDFTVTHNTRTLLNMAVNAARHGANVLIFSIEIEKEQYANLLYSCITEMLYSKIDDHALSPEDIAKINAEVLRFGTEYGHITVLDTQGGINTTTIKHKIEEIESKRNVNYDIVVIDHASMVNPSMYTAAGKDNENQAKVALEMKDLARFTRKSVVTAVQHKQTEQTSKRAAPDSLSGEGAVSRSDFWYQVPDILMIIQNSQEESEKNIFGTLKFKVISRFSQHFRFELLKDFSVTKLYSSEGFGFTPAPEKQ